MATAGPPDRAPRVGLGLVLARTRPGLASVGDVAIALEVLTALIAEHDVDGSAGPLHIDVDDGDAIMALAVVEYEGAPLLISADSYRGALRSWQLDGRAGPLQVEVAHWVTIGALAVVEYEGAPLLISASYGELRSWQLDGSAGPLGIEDAHRGMIGALAVVEYEGAPLVISAADDRELRSWRLDGSAGPLRVEVTHRGMIGALAVVEYECAPLVISASVRGELRSWRVTAPSLAGLASSAAHEIEMRELSLGSLEIVVLLPPDVLTTVGVTTGSIAVAGVVSKLDAILDRIKRVAGFAAEVRLQRTRHATEQLIAEAEQLEAAERLADVRARQRRRRLEAGGWEVERAVVARDDERLL